MALLGAMAVYDERGSPVRRATVVWGSVEVLSIWCLVFRAEGSGFRV